MVDNPTEHGGRIDIRGAIPDDHVWIVSVVDEWSGRTEAQTCPRCRVSRSGLRPTIPRAIEDLSRPTTLERTARSREGKG